MTTPPPGDGHWPARESDTLLPETVVAEPPGRPGSRLGWGLLIGILLVGLAAAAVAAVWYFTLDDGGTKAARGATVTRPASIGGESTTRAATTATPTPTAPAIVPIPDLTGTQLAAALRRLSGDGLLASVQYVSGDEPLGTVRTQSPQPGKTARSHSHVTVNASSGPGDHQKDVPDTTGQTLDQAVTTLDKAGLRLIFVKLPVANRAQAGKVVEQTPAAGTTAPENAQVVVYLGAFGG